MADEVDALEPVVADEDTSTPEGLFGKKEPAPAPDTAPDADADAAPANPEPEPPTEDVKNEVPAGKPAKVAKATPEPAKSEDDTIIEIDGQKMSLSEYRKFRADAETWRHQASHFQSKYTEALEQITRPAPKVDEAAKLAAPITVDKWKQDRDEDVAKMVTSGILSQEDAELSPDLARVTAALYAEAERARQFQAVATDLYQRVFVPMVQANQAEAAELQRQSLLGSINSKFEEVASIGEYFAPLANPETRNTFLQYLSQKVNPEVSRLTADDAVEFLASQFVAMNRDPLLQAVNAAAKQRAAAAASARRNMPGETPTVGVSAAVAPGKMDDIKALFGAG